MSLSHRILFSIIATASLTRAQPSAPSTPRHAHTPPASLHRPGVVVLDQFVTSASPFARNQAELAQATTVLSGQALLLKQQASLGETLSGETGIHASSFGPGSSRPIIRGLGGDRIRLLENSVGTGDASVISPDHAVSVEPLLVERIEVVRGPAALLYGSNAVGGVVNVITHRIETDLPIEPFRARAEFRAGTVADELAGGGVVDFALATATHRAWVVHVDGFRRRAENLRIPDFAESERVRAEETEHAAADGELPPQFVRGHLPNSGLETSSGAVGVSYVSPTFHFGLSQSALNSDYGVPGHFHEDAGAGPSTAEGVRIDLRQRRTDLQGEWHGDRGFVHGVRFKFSQARYRHAEIEPDGVLGTLFTNRSHEARFEVLHGEAKPWTGALGAQLTRSNFAAVGAEAFLPPSRTASAAVFAFEEIAAGPLTWQVGARYERTRVAPDTAALRRDDELAASLGVVWKAGETHTVALSIAQTGRAPNAQELYADGPHAGTQAFEVGAPDLRAERSLGVELGVRRNQGFVTGALTLFAHDFRGFIFEDPTGFVAVEGETGWDFVVPDSGDAEASEEVLPVYRYVQRDAHFWGVELETIWHLHESTRWNLDVRFAGDFTRAREGGRTVPRIPPARAAAAILWSSGAWSAGAEGQMIFEQNRVAPNEATSDGYTLVSAQVSRTIEAAGAHLELFLRGSNLGNVEARPHTSFVKDLAPLAGRGAVAGVRVSF